MQALRDAFNLVGQRHAVLFRRDFHFKLIVFRLRSRAGVHRTCRGVAVFALADANNFYASCETVFRPDLRGKPIVVARERYGLRVRAHRAAAGR